MVLSIFIKSSKFFFPFNALKKLMQWSEDLEMNRLSVVIRPFNLWTSLMDFGEGMPISARIC